MRLRSNPNNYTRDILIDNPKGIRVVSLTKMKVEKDNNNFMINSTWKHVINFLLIKKNYDLFLYYLILTILNSLSHKFGNGLKDKSFKNELRN